MERNLFNIDADMFQLQQEINENGGELTEEQHEKLIITEEERNVKCEGYVYVAKSCDNKADFIEEEAKRLLSIAKNYRNTAKVLRQILLDSIVNIGPVKTDKMSISYRKYKSVDIIDETAIPADFLRLKYEPMKTEIKKAIESGEEIPGAVIKETNGLLVK